MRYKHLLSDSNDSTRQKALVFSWIKKKTTGLVVVHFRKENFRIFFFFCHETKSFLEKLQGRCPTFTAATWRSQRFWMEHSPLNTGHRKCVTTGGDTEATFVNWGQALLLKRPSICPLCDFYLSTDPPNNSSDSQPPGRGPSVYRAVIQLVIYLVYVTENTEYRVGVMEVKGC